MTHGFILLPRPSFTSLAFPLLARGAAVVLFLLGAVYGLGGIVSSDANTYRDFGGVSVQGSALRMTEFSVLRKANAISLRHKAQEVARCTEDGLVLNSYALSTQKITEVQPRGFFRTFQIEGESFILRCPR